MSLCFLSGLSSDEGDLDALVALFLCHWIVVRLNAVFDSTGVLWA
jgi:hypothetical protein